MLANCLIFVLFVQLDVELDTVEQQALDWGQFPWELALSPPRLSLLKGNRPHPLRRKARPGPAEITPPIRGSFFNAFWQRGLSAGKG